MRNGALKNVLKSITSTPISADEMDILLNMAYVILMKNSHFNGTEIDTKKWETIKNGPRNYYYPCTRLTKLWMHLITFYKIQQEPDFGEQQRKHLVQNFAKKTTIVKLDGTKFKYQCTGAGSDSFKKSCRALEPLKSAWNAVLHAGHKHGIV